MPMIPYVLSKPVCGKCLFDYSQVYLKHARGPKTSKAIENEIYMIVFTFDFISLIIDQIRWNLSAIFLIHETPMALLKNIKSIASYDVFFSLPHQVCIYSSDVFLRSENAKTTKSKHRCLSGH